MEEYGILGGYEDGLDEDDEKGSRAVPSRTSFGCESAFVEKFPEYGKTKWGVRSWGYRCFLTIPQIELMQSDLPHTLYNFKKKVVVDDEAIRLQEEANKKARARRENQGQRQYTLDEIFAGAADSE